MQGIVLGLLLINICISDFDNKMETNLQEVASWKKVTSPLEDRVVTQNSLIGWRNKLKLGK